VLTQFANHSASVEQWRTCNERATSLRRSRYSTKSTLMISLQRFALSKGSLVISYTNQQLCAATSDAPCSRKSLESTSRHAQGSQSSSLEKD
jgi:hypothetical protein